MYSETESLEKIKLNKLVKVCGKTKYLAFIIDSCDPTRLVNLFCKVIQTERFRNLQHCMR